MSQVRGRHPHREASKIQTCRRREARTGAAPGTLFWGAGLDSTFCRRILEREFYSLTTEAQEVNAYNLAEAPKQRGTRRFGSPCNPEKTSIEGEGQGLSLESECFPGQELGT